MQQSDMDKLGDIVRAQLTTAEGGQSDELQMNREEALQYYNGEKPLPSDVDGRSDYVSMDVANVCNAVSAMMREMLVLDAELVIEAEGEGDEDNAKAESDICTDVLLKDNDGEIALISAIKDGLMLKNGCMKVRMTEGGCHVQAVPIENISYTANWSGNLQDVPFLAERIDYTRSELVEMGIKRSVVDDLPSGDAYDTGTRTARNQVYSQSRDGETRDQDVIECHEAYVLADLDGDGISERYVCLVADQGTCLEYEEALVLPYALGSPILRPHRLTGESLFDHLRHIQDKMTKAHRQWEDNVSVMNNGRYIYDPSRTNEEDIFTPTPGGGIRARDPGAVVPLMVPDVSGGIMVRIEELRRQRTEASGGSLDMASAEAQVANKAATVASIEKGSQELLASYYASNFAITMLRDLYRLIHFNLREYSERTYLARVNGQAVSVDPRQWPPRTRMTVKSGMSPSLKSQVTMALAQHLQLQAQAMMNGLDGVLATPETLFRTQSQWLRLSGVDNVESLILDPASPAAVKAQDEKTAQAQAMQAQQMQMMQQQVQLDMQHKQALLAEDARQHDEKMELERLKLNADVEIEEAKLAGQGTIDLEKERMKNEQADRQAERAARASAADNGDAA